MALQETPTAVQLIDGSKMEQLHIPDVTDLTNLVTGLKMDVDSTDRVSVRVRYLRHN